MAHGWEGQLTRLVPLDIERHLQNAMSWVNDPELTQTLLIGDRPMTQIAERSWFEEQSKPNPQEISFAIETLDGEHIGFSGIHRIQWPDGMAITGSFIGPIDRRGKGYGSDAARTRTRYAFDVLGLRMLRSEAFSENAASIRMLERCGYVRYGELPNGRWKRGEFRSMTLLYLSRERWLELNG